MLGSSEGTGNRFLFFLLMLFTKALRTHMDKSKLSKVAVPIRRNAWRKILSCELVVSASCENRRPALSHEALDVARDDDWGPSERSWAGETN